MVAAAALGVTEAATGCALCGATTSRRVVAQGLTIAVCKACRLARLEHVPEQAEVYERYRGPGYFRFWGTGPWEETEKQKRVSARWLLARLERIRKGKRGRLLEVGCASGELLVEARDRGWEVRGIELCRPMVERANARLGDGTVTEAPFGDTHVAVGSVDSLVFNDVIEHLPDLSSALATSRSVLAPGGTLCIGTPDLGSLSARLMGKRWPHYKAEHLHYLSRRSLAAYLERAGFSVQWSGNLWKGLSIAYASEHFRVYGSSRSLSLLGATLGGLPDRIRHVPIPVLTGNLLMLAGVAP